MCASHARGKKSQSSNIKHSAVLLEEHGMHKTRTNCALKKTMKTSTQVGLHITEACKSRQEHQPGSFAGVGGGIHGSLPNESAATLSIPTEYPKKNVASLSSGRCDPHLLKQYRTGMWEPLCSQVPKPAPSSEMPLRSCELWVRQQGQGHSLAQAHRCLQSSQWPHAPIFTGE